MRYHKLFAAAIGLGACVGVTGCGWLAAGGVSHSKPDGFVLRGYVTVAVAGTPAGGQGTPCQSPAAGIAAGDEVRVADPPGHPLGSTALGAGVLAMDGGAYRCNFPFQIGAVPGGHRAYAITVGSRPAVSFPATDLREDKPAIIALG